MFSTAQQIAEFLVNHGYAPPSSRYAGYLPTPRRHPLAWRYAQPPSIEALAHDLLASAEDSALRLGDFLGTVDGAIITEAVEMAMPPYLRPDIELLVEGLKLAANLQKRDGRKVAGGVAVLSGLAFMFFLSLVRHNFTKGRS